MIPEQIMKSLAITTPSKIVLLVMDGVGDLRQGGETPLEAACTPNFDQLAVRSSLGLTDPIAPGITPGSGPAHVSLFGYDPLKYKIGRGILEATGIEMAIGPDDVATRGNFASMDQEGNLTDRRAGRIPTEENERLIGLLSEQIKEIDGVQIILRTVKEHRFVALFRGPGLDGQVADTDPQALGVPSLDPVAQADAARKTAQIAKKFIAEMNRVLAKEKPANTGLLRGFSQLPDIPSMGELFRLKPACIATYPMYRGLARLVGMDLLETGPSIADEFDTLRQKWQEYDFFFIHIKKTDSYGEDGNYADKVKIIEEVDRSLPDLFKLNPDVIAVTGDHSTPCLLASHSWHPNPFLLCSKYVRMDDTSRFTEAQCATGVLGRHPATDAVPLMLANALKLEKYGA